MFAETMVTSAGKVRLKIGNDKYWECLDLQQTLGGLGWRVTYEKDLMGTSGIFGDMDPNRRVIRIDASLSWNERFEVLAHEGAHTLQPYRLTENQAEVFAESVSMLVAHDGLREHARYLATMRGDLLVMIAYWPDIYRAAAVLEMR